MAGASLEVCERRVAFPHYVHASASKRRHDGLIYAPGGEDVVEIHPPSGRVAAADGKRVETDPSDGVTAPWRWRRVQFRTKALVRIAGFIFEFFTPAIMASEGLFYFSISFLMLSFSLCG